SYAVGRVRPMDRDALLTAAQQRVVSELMARDQPRPSFPSSLGDDLRANLEAALAPLAGALADPVWVSKTALAQVHACESNYLAEQDWQGWNSATAQGEVTHRAIQLSVTLDGDTTPLELVDHALTDLAGDDARSLSSFLRQLSPPARGELRARASNAVATFLECWPPLPASWWPRTELPVRTDLCDGRIVLSGKIDLSLGHAVGAEARCLFVDLKTGGHYPAHLDDLRFYALIQAVRIGVPPFRVASYYLDSASFAAEDVTAETLGIAVRRTVDGVRKMIEVRTGDRSPTITPCPRCRYCRIRAECEGARDWEARSQSADSDPD
ncbi:MAG: PD-(D/E)XK nuclease family protein, partial [Actinomycetota bacterium]|nr:PD-(D/E)XK nuclease family protein [Actinomycetota bacterium]